MTESQSGRDRVVSIFIKAPIQRVWEEITKTDSAQRALYNTTLVGDLSVGSRVRFTSADQKRVFVVGEVIEVTRPTRFVHTYIMTMQRDPETTIAWDLAVEGDGCRVTLTHSGWTEEHTTEDKTVAAWNEILSLLRSEIETGSLPMKTRITYTMMRLFSFVLPKRTTSEHADQQGW